MSDDDARGHGPFGLPYSGTGEVPVPAGIPVRFSWRAELSMIAYVADDGTVTVTDCAVTPDQYREVTADHVECADESARGDGARAAFAVWADVSQWPEPKLSADGGMALPEDSQ